MKQQMKWLLFPGLNLHARLRYRVMPGYFGQPTNGEERLVLDAGCGNGMLSYQAYLKGNRVIGVSIKDEVQRNQQFFNKHHSIPEEKLAFRDINLYEIDSIPERFDEIICCEVMEHIKGDEQVCTHFFKILKPGGTLHICCPNAAHPFHQNYPLDPDETGGHVRPGYTYESYKQLLEPIGFELSDPIGIGGPIRHLCNEPITRIQGVGGYPLGLAAFALLSPWSVFDTTKPKLPFSLYVQAKKPAESTN